MDSWLIALSVVAALLVSILCLFLFFRAGRRKAPSLPEEKVAVPKPVPPEPQVAEPSLPAKPRKRSSLAVSLEKFWKGNSLEKREDWELLEEALLEGDVGPSTASALLKKVQEAGAGDGVSVAAALRAECVRVLTAPQPKAFEGQSPWVVSLVGVNGAGKTTTVGKLASRFSRDGKKVLLGAVDTFRAAAVEQLRVWAERTKSDFVHGRDGGDPGAVAFDAVSAGKARAADVVLLDTAGRLHTKSNLMDELTRVHKVIAKVEPTAPHEIWLVLDGTLGQNSVQQAREFKNALALTGVVVTKLDGTAKGGAVIAIASELGLPVRFIGVGEGLEDLIPFEPKAFVDSLLS